MTDWGYMRAETISQPNAIRQLPLIAVETGLLELFAPTRSPSLEAVALPRSEYAPLWRADAIHRAKNMAQMTTSLANVADHPSRRWLPPEVTTEARRLSRAYDELGADDDAQLRVPCAPLLTEIVTPAGRHIRSVETGRNFHLCGDGSTSI